MNVKFCQVYECQLLSTKIKVEVNFCQHPPFKILRSMTKLKIKMLNYFFDMLGFVRYLINQNFSSSVKKNRAKYGISFAHRQISVAVNCIQ